ncbi:hypothetical protein [Spirosoma agri]|uniref:Uncharacterized protein n=1 Tax=Spirosoma agri TaxID=1987381 RepID=A0A6M0IHK5_9BACT|nr:hypothetical protein [Spirosoma agri]NEU67759.1 hypothetical protein [Spirosoma agri]
MNKQDDVFVLEPVEPNKQYSQQVIAGKFRPSNKLVVSINGRRFIITVQQVMPFNPTDQQLSPIIKRFLALRRKNIGGVYLQTQSPKPFDFKKLAERSAIVDAHITQGGKLEELSGFNFILPAGLSSRARKQ